MTGTGTSGELHRAPLSRAEGYKVVSKSPAQDFFTYSCLSCLVSDETVHGFAPEGFCCSFSLTCSSNPLLCMCEYFHNAPEIYAMTFSFLKAEAVDKSLGTAKYAVKSYYPSTSM